MPNKTLYTPPYIGRIRLKGSTSVSGTGFIVYNTNKSGLIATCYHVLRDASDGNPIGKVFTFQPLEQSESFDAVTQENICDEKNDVALLRISGLLPPNLKPARLVSSTRTEPGMEFNFVGFGVLDNQPQQLAPAIGQIVGPSTLGPDDINFLELTTKQAKPGMSGGPIIVPDVGGVVGIQSKRYNLDPKLSSFGEHTAWAARIERLVDLEPKVLKLSPARKIEVLSIHGRVLRWLPIPLLLLAIGLGALLAYVLSPHMPPLVNSPFNVAIAGFGVDPASGISDADAQILSEAFYSNFKVRIDEINPELTKIGGTVGIWTPAQVGKVLGLTKEERERNARVLVDGLKSKNASVDLLVYGIITKQDDNIAVLPEFYDSNPSPELSEVNGRFELASALAVPGAQELKALSGQLSDRSEVLALITQGLVQQVVRPPQYDKARQAYAQALIVGQNATGTELVHVLMANASLSHYNQIAAVGTGAELTRLPQLFQDVQSDFNAAVKLNPAYARAYAGLGSLLYLHAVESAGPQQNWNKIDEATLQIIESSYKKALEVSDRPESADIPTKVDFGLGEVNTLRYLRGDQAALSEAEAKFNQIISDYNNGNLHIKEFAAQSYGFLGLLGREHGDYNAAKDAYNSAIILTELDARKELFKRGLLQITISQRRAARDVGGAAQAMDELLKHKMPPTDAADILYQKAKMYSEADQKQAATAAYEQALKLDLSSAPTLAAQIWANLGTKYYELGRIADSTSAYQQAMQLDPIDQKHLAKLIQENDDDLRMATVHATPSATSTNVMPQFSFSTPTSYSTAAPPINETPTRAIF